MVKAAATELGTFPQRKAGRITIKAALVRSLAFGIKPNANSATVQIAVDREIVARRADESGRRYPDILGRAEHPHLYFFLRQKLTKLIAAQDVRYVVDADDLISGKRGSADPLLKFSFVLRRRDDCRLAARR